MRIRQIYLTAVLAAASAAVATTLAAAPPAAADCVSAKGPNPLTLCSPGGDIRISGGVLVQPTPFVPLDCDVDWLCDMGESIARGD